MTNSNIFLLLHKNPVKTLETGKSRWRWNQMGYIYILIFSTKHRCTHDYKIIHTQYDLYMKLFSFLKNYNTCCISYFMYIYTHTHTHTVFALEIMYLQNWQELMQKFFGVAVKCDTSNSVMANNDFPDSIWWSYGFFQILKKNI